LALISATNSSNSAPSINGKTLARDEIQISKSLLHLQVVKAVARRAERRLVVLAVDGHVAGIGISD
jgi:cob(I)alamin adenosyltransferase